MTIKKIEKIIPGKIIPKREQPTINIPISQNKKNDKLDIFKQRELVKNDITFFLNKIKDMSKEDWEWEIARFTDKLANKEKNIINIFYDIIQTQMDEFNKINKEKDTDKTYRQLMDFYYAVCLVNF